MLISAMQNHWGKSLNYLLVLVISLCLSACDQESSKAESEVRLAVVNTPHDSGLLTFLLEDFETQTGMRVTVHSSEDPFPVARDGKADMLISHYGKAGMAEFVSAGYGSWPKMVFSNQAALIGPKDDPAGVRQTSSLGEAFKAIAESGNTLIAHNSGGINELMHLARLVAGMSVGGTWYQDSSLSKGRAIIAADKAHAYVIWGAIPFLKFKTNHDTNMEILFSRGPLFQRVMALSLVNAEFAPNVNREGAEALADYLLSAETQAKITRYRVTGSDHQLWWPAARDN